MSLETGPKLSAWQITHGVEIEQINRSTLFKVHVPPINPDYPLVEMKGAFYECQVTGALIEESVVVPMGVKLGGLSIIGQGVIFFGNNVVGPRSIVKERTYLKGSAKIGANCYIGPRCTLGERVSIGGETYIGNRVYLPQGLDVPGVSYIGSRNNAATLSVASARPFNVPSIEVSESVYSV